MARGKFIALTIYDKSKKSQLSKQTGKKHKENKREHRGSHHKNMKIEASFGQVGCGEWLKGDLDEWFLGDTNNVCILFGH